MKKQKKHINIYLLLPIISGTCWGTAGIFVRNLDEAGLDNITINFSKFTVAAVLMGFVMLIINRKAFKIDIRDLPVLTGIGVFGALFLNYAYTEAVIRTSLSLAAVLLCLAPVFVLIFGAVLFGEKMTRTKLICISMAIFGSILLSGLLDDGGTLPWDTIGFLFGLSSAVANAAYTILSKIATNKGYGSMTIYFYSYILILAFMIPFVDFTAIGNYLVSEPVAAPMNFFGFVVWTSLLPCVIYTVAVRHADAGKVATLASGAEPVSSMVTGIFMYHEIPSILGFAGMFLTVTALVLLVKVEEKET
ncbi:MAG: EamA family transporter [Firmicutes bacterium]|nr:EamA family transporter [Bacillota bacterium]